MNFNAIINGKEIITKDKIDIFSPWTLKSMGKVSKLNDVQINSAFECAKKSQVDWSKTVLSKRIEILLEWLNQIKINKIKIAKIIVDEIAKSYNDSLIEVERTIEYFEYTLEEAKRINPKSYTADAWGNKSKIGIFSYVPKGVILTISPFNYPINLAISKIVPALVMGNAVVFKPATNGSMTGLFLGKISLLTNIPKGIFNVVTGRGSEIGDSLIKNNNVNLISFTGSVPIGKNIKKNSYCKDLILELGGKDPAIILDEINIENTVKQIVSGAFSYSGQRCTAIKKVITTNKIADKLVPLLEKEIKKMSINTKENGIVNPLISIKAALFIKELVENAVSLKAKIIIGNKYKDNFVFPTIVDYVTDKMRLAWEEPFGPILPIIRIDNVDEMISHVNKSSFGLQASIFSLDINKAINISKLLEVGTVNINGKSQRGPDSFPFLGVKDSGSGVQGIRESLLSSSRIKGLVINYYLYNN